MADDLQTGTTTYTYNAFNQMITAVNGNKTTIYTYDANGNLISEHGGNEDKTYTYDADNRLITVNVSSGNNVTIESYTYDYEGNRITKQTNEEEKVYYLNDTFDVLTYVSLELYKNEDGTFGVSRYYTRGTELISADIYDKTSGTSEVGEDTEVYETIQYIMDGHGSVTALAVTTDKGSIITDTYTYDAYGNLLKHKGETENDFLYTGEQYNALTGLYYLRARYMNPEMGTFISVDSYAGTLDNPVSLHKYLYANANPVMYTDPTGYFSLMETSVAQSIQGVLNSVIVPAFNLKKIMSWANLAVTIYDVATQVKLFLVDGENFLGVVAAIAKGMITQALLNCATKVLLGEAATAVLKVLGIAQDAGSFVEAVKSGDPEKIVVESIRLTVSLFTLKAQCFTGETLVSTTKGDIRIDEIKEGDYVWSYDTETNERVASKVTNVSVSKTDVIVNVYTSDGNETKTTMLHPFYVENGNDGSYNGEWKAASNLVKGDRLKTEDERIVYVEEVRTERLDEKVEVYNLEVEGTHTYYVGGGVLVHNECLSERTTGTYGELVGSGQKDAHHIIQDAAMRDIPGYNRMDAPAIQLDGPSNVVGTEHYYATITQRRKGGGTYGSERGIAYMSLRKAGLSVDEAKAIVRSADEYFMGKLGLTLDSPTRIPGNRRK